MGNSLIDVTNIRMNNYDRLTTNDIVGKPITWEGETIGVLEYADDWYMYGKVKSEYLEPLDHIMAISVVTGA